MKIIEQIKKLPILAILLLLLLVIYLIFRIIIFLSKFFVFIGFNFFAYLDYLLKFEWANPILIWSIFGLFFGAIIGVIISIKKYKLSKKLVVYPIGTTLILIILLSFINKPYNINGAYKLPLFDESITPSTPPSSLPTFSLIQDINVRYGPSVHTKRLFVIPKGGLVTVIENHYDWVKIEYYNPKTSTNKTGYVKMKYLRQNF